MSDRTQPVDTPTRAPRAPKANPAAKAKPSPRIRSEVEWLAEVSTKLDRVVAMLAAQGKDRDTQVAILAGAGCDSTFVATVVGMTPGAVRNLPAWRRAKPEQAPGAASAEAAGAASAAAR